MKTTPKLIALAFCILLFTVAHVQTAQAGDIVETSIDGTFNGWKGETIWKMDNGDIWQQSSYDYFYSYSYHPKVLIYRDGGNWKMKVHGENREISVKKLDGGDIVETCIDGNFDGWKGETIWKMDNGDIWQQSSLGIHLHLAIHPKVLIYRTSTGWKMKVDGDDEDVAVKKLK